MHAPIGQKTHQMKGSSAFYHPVESLVDRIVSTDASLSACFVYTRKLLVYDTARSNVQMTHLGISHLTVGQAYGFSRSLHGHERSIGEKPIEIRCVRQRNSVSLRWLIEAEAVHDDKQGRQIQWG